MNNTAIILRNVLALDSLYHFLNEYERWLCHKMILSKNPTLTLPKGGKQAVTEQIRKACDIVEKQKYEAPEFKYMPDRVLYYYNEKQEDWVKATEYKPMIRSIIFRELKQPKK